MRERVAVGLTLCLLAITNPALAEQPSTPTTEYARAASVVKTQVDGEFEGCDFDRLITFANGLIFRCAEYYYTYAYRPKVQIITLIHGRVIVSINGRRYQGKLVREDDL